MHLLRFISDWWWLQVAKQRVDRDGANNGQKANEGLKETIIAAIKAHPYKAIPFREFMDFCLYHPLYGYYMRDEVKVGKEGDFYTSASVGSVMGDMLAESFMNWTKLQPSQERFTLVEWGGGNGRMARQVMDRLLKRDNNLYNRTELVMIEKSSFHRGLQREQLAEHPKIRWLDVEDWQHSSPWRSVFLWANELLDAFPVHRIKMIDGVLHEIWVTWDDNRQNFNEIYFPLENEALRTYFDSQGIRLKEGQVAEVNMEAQDWIGRLGEQLVDSRVTLIDYGDVAEEIYAPHRLMGTLMCYRQHRASDDPYVYVGEQDITAHVNFSAIRKAAEDAGFYDIQLVSQTEFLLAGGVLEWLQDQFDPDPFSEVARRNRAIRQLLVSDRMGDLFKVMTMSK